MKKERGAKQKKKRKKNKGMGLLKKGNKGIWGEGGEMGKIQNGTTSTSI